MHGPVFQMLESISVPWANWMTSMSIQLTILVLALVFLDRLLRRYSARLRHMLWLLVLVRLMLAPSLAAPTSLAWWVSDMLPGGLGGMVDMLEPQSTTSSPETPSVVHGSVLQEKGISDVVWIGENVKFSTILFLFWFGVVWARLTFLAYAQLQISKWVRSADEISDDVTLSLLARAKSRVGIRRRVSLRDSHSCSTPLVTGWFRIVVLLPTNVRLSLSNSELESVLVHELTHVARWDSFTRVLQAIVSSVYFFHPGLWIANRYLRRTCEDACDEQTIAALAGRRKCYAEAILKAAALVGYEPPQLALSMLDDAYPVKQRLQRILDPKLNVAFGGGLTRAIALIAAALVLLPSGLPTTAGSLELANTREYAPVQDQQHFDDPQQTQASNEEVAIEQLQSTEFEVRLAGYQTLQRIGTVLSLEALEAAYLKRGGVEQDFAKRALDAVWKQVESTPSQSKNPARLIQSIEEL